MRETEIVEHIRRLSKAGYRGRSVIKSIGDDCAVMRPSPSEDLVFTCDLVCEGRHFTRDTHSSADIGHKALARSLSDLAAMGAEPVFCLVSLAVPPQLATTWMKGFYKGLLALANEYKVTLAGGDTSQFEKVIADVICCGRVPRGEALLRSGAQPGDHIYVTGDLGQSALGLATQSGKAWRRHRRPEPRVSVGRLLFKLGVSSCMDLSDGLSLDLMRLTQESKVSARLDTLPIARGATVEQALHGGEDYELLFTAAPDRNFPPKLAGVSVNPIGLIEKGNPGRILFGNKPLLRKGFDHFQ